MNLNDTDNSIVDTITEMIYNKEIILGIPNSEYQPHIMYYLDNLIPDVSLNTESEFSEERLIKSSDKRVKTVIIKYMVRIEYAKFAHIWTSMCHHYKQKSFMEAFIDYIKLNMYPCC